MSRFSNSERKPWRQTPELKQKWWLEVQGSHYQSVWEEDPNVSGELTGRTGSPVLKHTLRVAWGEGIEKVLDDFRKWAERGGHLTTTTRGKDPTAMLWNLACFRLKQGPPELSWALVANTLNRLPKFTEKRSAFDENSAAKAAREIKKLLKTT